MAGLHVDPWPLPLAKALLLCVSLRAEGWWTCSRLRTRQRLRCFHSIQAIRSVIEARPLRIGFGVACLAVCHQSSREASWFGGRHVICRLERTSCHTCLEKGHVMSRWCIVSGSWSHKTHLGWCCRRRLRSLSALLSYSVISNIGSISKLSYSMHGGFEFLRIVSGMLFIFLWYSYEHSYASTHACELAF
jgi:hypothetical protein